MMKHILTIFFLICAIVLSGQKGTEIDVFAGPNITNVIRRENTLPTFVGLTDRRPYSSINYLLGVKVKKNIRNIDFSASIMFEKIRNSSDRFNERYRPGSNDNINYLATTIELSKAPLLHSDVKLALGWSFYYALNKRIGRRDLFAYKRAVWGPVTSLQFPVSKRITFNSRVFFGLNNLKQELSGGTIAFTTTQKPFSFQFVLNYTIINK